ncbi:MAG: histidine--tRNA ligase [Prevotellaceae bacterium]|jgi:histidyl-tRNA synthetase|nr:histidine--tRNA ligase [Prevotellaceae bacterium]
MKPSIPKGTRDFTPAEMAKRNYIFDTIKSVFRLYGFQQIETPAMENLSTLMGKYGEEGDKLLFKILNSGNFMDGVDAVQTQSIASLTKKISEKGLRYDLTVPFARFVVQHQNEISFPFKRFQIQPVWRADRPQKGRYREFFQCDADVVGSDSLLNEVELVQIIDEVYRRFGIDVIIKINNRKILSGISEIIGAEDKIVDITVAIDKLDKIGIENVTKELQEKGISAVQIAKLQPILELKGTNSEKLSQLKSVLTSSEIGMKGIEELETIFNFTQDLAIKNEMELDLTLARGLNYYTGAIFEVKAKNAEMGSISGGGRYDNLTGVFGLKGISGVGISFGADRIYDVLNQLNLYPADSLNHTQILFACFGDDEIRYALPWLKALREKGIIAEIYPEAGKMKKQLSYADNKHIPFVAVIGSNEMEANKVMLKNMNSGEQQLIDLQGLLNKFN